MTQALGQRTPRTSPLGWFGALCIVLLLTFSALNLLNAFLLDPDWFDDIAFWRGPIYPREAVDAGLLRTSFEGAPTALLPSFADTDGDPFVGTWSGKLSLRNGSLAAPMTALVNYLMQTMDEKEAAAVAMVPDEASRQEMQAAWEHKKEVVFGPVIRAITSAASAGEWFAKTFGIKTTFVIAHDSAGGYTFRVTRLLLIETPGLPAMTVSRVGEHSIGFPFPYEKLGLEPVLLRLHRKDEVRDGYAFDETLGGERVNCEFRWAFRREAAAPSAAVPATTP